MKFSYLLAFSTVGVIGLVIPGVSTYFLTRRDLRGRKAVLAAVVCAVLVGVATWFAVFFAIFAFLASAVVYLVMRRLVRTGPALATTTIVLVGLLIFSVRVMDIALSEM
ncbi:hypothetical protein RKE30_26835 [Streptomyces sp. Li-HN-5-11]|uniref:hypothetical protein n=1 Tax=Streptomyces sp. Li-HN-5-11 TaxID=3075432 RepID=UPI0028A7E406|nr:hypothetical protein [Streptomyces sp. Li-HN-5-11]WNM33737.1 hypothetical protein RKE30_26835 [Streptomyces sp. Li-HN-5-11]